MLPVIAGAALYGYAQRKGWEIPTILGLPPAASSAVILYFLGKQTFINLAPDTRQKLRMAALGPACLAAFSLGERSELSGHVGGHGVVYD